MSGGPVGRLHYQKEHPMTLITSLDNPRIKAALRLREGRHRRKQGRFLIDGLREIRRAALAGVTLVEVYFCQEKCRQSQRGILETMRESVPSEFVEVSPAVFEKLAFGNRAEGIVAVAEAPEWRLDGLDLPEMPLVAVIVGIEKPGNVGAVLRSADAAGVDAVIVVDGGTDLFNPNTVRASLGTLFTLPVREATTEETLAWLRRHELAILAARVDGAVPYTEVNYRRPTAIVLGSEAKGLDRAWAGDDITAIALPMRGEADSLNISVTAAVLFYEALRQRAT
jgi:RNA methyltransferase, TrmH family